ncbi:UbiX family flavin prenyltransferase [Planctomicrobium sp. SH661]|uniref:UbiX family flavin prenyltransferase n=1 Tax=Planctomicrobium sp. SH661 TaxID=3448124 RepID=UPI003F5B64A7
MNPIVLAMTGASGAAYAVRLLDALLASGNAVHLTISPAAAHVIDEELGVKLNLDHFELTQFEQIRGENTALDSHRIGSHGSSIFVDSEIVRGKLTYHHYRDFSAGIASGSFQTAGMVICPCSMGTLASVANGLSSNLIQRAADVHLKERRKLIVVPRETPLGSIQLQNMKTLSDAGAVILPAMPGFYHRPTTIQELIDFVVARICDQLGVKVDLTKRWGKQSTEQELPVKDR